MTIQELADALARNYGHLRRTSELNIQAHQIIRQLNRHGAAVLAHITWIHGRPDRIVNVFFDGELIHTFEPADDDADAGQLHEKPAAYHTRRRPQRYRIAHHSQETTCAQCAEPLYVGDYAHEQDHEVFCSTVCANRFFHQEEYTHA